MSTQRTATCQCGQLSATVRGDPVRVSVCHCHACQQRSGSAFSWQARWPETQVNLSGEARTWSRAGDEGGIGTFSFCPRCGSSVYYVSDGLPGLIAVALGGFAGENPLPPRYSVYEERKQSWIEVLGEGVERMR